MSRKIFLNVKRGMTSTKLVCVYPWEKPILELVHGEGVNEVSIDQLTEITGHVKVEKMKMIREKVEPPPSLREQLEMQVQVDPDEDPINNPESEYERLVGKYGMDKDLPIACVTRVYGEMNGGGLRRAIQEAQGPAVKLGPQKPIEEMTVKELRVYLESAGVEVAEHAGKAELLSLAKEELLAA